MKEIVAFGDSNTWGLIPGTDARYTREKRWTGILQSKRDDIYIYEEGLCGRTTVFDDALRPGRNAFKSLPVILEGKSPLDGVIIMLGTNDCKQVYKSSPYIIGKGMEKCLDIAERFVPVGKILLISPILLGEEVWRPEKDPEFDPLSVEICRELKDVYSRIAEKRGYAFIAASDVATASGIDDEHLDEAGHKALAEAVNLKLGEIFS